MEHKTLYMETLRHYCPELPLRVVEAIESGQNNDVLLVNGEWIFRFPKYVEGIERLRYEVGLLNTVKERVSIPVPAPAKWNLQSERVGNVFVGYPRIPGEPLLDGQWNELESAGVPMVRGIARQLAAFLNELHRIPADALGESGPEYDGYREWSDLFERIRAKLYPHMNRDAQRWTERHFASFLGNGSNFRIVPVLVHGDLGGSNILYDPRRREISGILDFGSSSGGPGGGLCGAARFLWGAVFAAYDRA
ncbi:phosphotransferase family protein [Paenibacillus sp. A3]|uniref:phosphotransferase family protein n=1 Tax=Paenibacillus sp. A3 TaxID=1337054 RepID=UPI0006D536F5|nr:phosphotransferase [Paenibacillus sp. A3]